MTISCQPQTSVTTIGDEVFVYTVTLLTEGTPTTKEVSLERLKEERELERISCAESQTVVERLEASFLALDLNVEHTTPKSAFFCVCDSPGSSSYLLKHTGLKKRSTQHLMLAFVLSTFVKLKKKCCVQISMKNSKMENPIFKTSHFVALAMLYSTTHHTRSKMQRVGFERFTVKSVFAHCITKSTNDKKKTF